MRLECLLTQVDLLEGENMRVKDMCSNLNLKRLITDIIQFTASGIVSLTTENGL